MKFGELQNKKDFCEFFSIDEKQINYILYSKKPKYFEFEIPKKHGGSRKISAPLKELKDIQRKLVAEFEKIYKKNECVKGFVKGENVVTNAKVHLKSSYILNIDLKDFFPSISFKRVNGLLRSYPFSFSYEFAVLLSNLLVNDSGALAQGAPTSPIISNMICSRLDHAFIKFSKQFHLKYSRYADDITFSWNSDSTTQRIISDSNVLCNEIKTIVKNNGFEINETKTRLQHKSMHQEVTGIVVNEKTNTPKFYYYKLRSMIHSWKKFGINDAYKEMCKREQKEYNEKNTNEYIRKVFGLLSYYKMVKGEKDETYIKMASKVNKLINNNYFDLDYSYNQIKEDAVYMVSDGGNTGTCFRMGGYLITCKHCVADITSDLPLFIYKNGHRYAMTKILYLSKNIDFAILDDPIKYGEANIKSGEVIKGGLDVKSLGFPCDEEDDVISEYSGKIINRISIKKQKYWKTDMPLMSGNSGGPVIDINNRLVGMVVYGADDSEDAKRLNGVMGIKEIKEELEKFKSSLSEC